MKKIAAITVGQSPRTDMVSDIAPLLPGVEILQFGALDGLTPAEIRREFGPDPGEAPVTTKLADGTPVEFSDRKILGRLQDCITRAEAAGASAILMLCTGAFPAFRSQIPVLQPTALVRAFVTGTLRGRRLGVLSPAAGKMQAAHIFWHDEGAGLIACAAALPYGDMDTVLAAAESLKAQGAAVILLDCMGFSRAQKRLVAEATGLEVILPRTVSARALAEILDV